MLPSCNMRLRRTTFAAPAPIGKRYAQASTPASSRHACMMSVTGLMRLRTVVMLGFVEKIMTAPAMEVFLLMSVTGLR